MNSSSGDRVMHHLTSIMVVAAALVVLVLRFRKGKHRIPYDDPWPISKSSIKTSKQHR
jgi:hypothetical protein